MNFKANYFDGKSSQTYSAEITPKAGFWKITYKNNASETKELNWKVSEIKKSEVYTKGLVSFSYGNEFPYQKIESSDPNFIDFIKKSTHKNIRNKTDLMLQKHGYKSIITLLSVILGLSLIIYFYVIPNSAVFLAKKLDTKIVTAFGNQIFKIISVDLEIDEQQSKNLQNFIDGLKLETEFPIKAYVAKDETINAFAVSGGKIVVFSGLLEKMENENQLAALLGHEISHIEERHMLKNIFRDMSGKVLISAWLGDLSTVSNLIGKNAHTISQLSYSRDAEKEADIYGLNIVEHNQLDLNGMPELFEIFKRESDIEFPKYLSSHPILDDRISYSKKIANQQTHQPQNQLLKERWQIIASAFSKNTNQ